MMSYIYGCESKDEVDEEIQINNTDNEIFVIDNYTEDKKVNLTDIQQCFQTWKAVTQSADCDCPYYNKNSNEDLVDDDDDDDDDDEQRDGSTEKENENENDVVVDRLSYLNCNDEDESTIEDKVYIISMNNIPYFYDDNLNSVRNTMWDIANNLLKNNDNEYDSSKHFILTNNSDEIKIIYPYNFFWFFNYNHTVAELKIDYAIKYNIRDNFKKKQE